MVGPQKGGLGNVKESQVKDLRIQYYKSSSDSKPELAVKIPFSVLHIAVSFLPKKLSALLEKEGIDISQSKDLVKEKELVGTIIEIENINGKIAISVD